MPIRSSVGNHVDAVIGSCTAVFILGGATIVAGSMWRWETTSINTQLGIERGEGQITVMLGLLAIALGVFLPLVRSTYLEVAFAAVGCTIAAAVVSFALRIISEYERAESILAFVQRTMGEGPWMLLAGGAVVGIASVSCLGHGLFGLTTIEDEEPA